MLALPVRKQALAARPPPARGGQRRPLPGRNAFGPHEQAPSDHLAARGHAGVHLVGARDRVARELVPSSSELAGRAEPAPQRIVVAEVGRAAEPGHERILIVMKNTH